MMILPASPPPPGSPGAPQPPPRAGVNSLLASTPFGFVISGLPGGGGSFNHPFRPALVGRDGVRLAKGLVDGFEPVIGAVPISGGGGKNLPPPTLRLTGDVANPRRESWVCVEVTPTGEGGLADAEGQLAEGVKIEVVHRGEPTLTGPVGRHPLALIVWGANAPARIFPVTFFNLRYHRTSPAPGRGPRRHYFF